MRLLAWNMPTSITWKRVFAAGAVVGIALGVLADRAYNHYLGMRSVHLIEGHPGKGCSGAMGLAEMGILSRGTDDGAYHLDCDQRLWLDENVAILCDCRRD